MGSSRTDRSDRQRFVIALAVFAAISLVAGLEFSEDVGLVLQDTPTTKVGWLFFGWFVGGPPYALTVLLWLERKRFSKQTRRVWSILLPFWISLSLFVLPARIAGADEHFGTAALVGIPLSFGWLWGMFSTGLMAFIAGVSVLALSLSVEPARARELIASRTTRIILERLWLILLVVALGIALYGGEGKGIFNNGI
ncbi:hypothetical protein ABIE44_001651 [Marmoricola sp. OAE513]|uniref:hypothetical protein n=1 Tax=Marmoricola sp. OAE513 TaxID=2817894 RepID=UPI001AE2FCC9